MALGMLLFFVAVSAFVVLVWHGWVNATRDIVNLARHRQTDHSSWRVIGIAALLFVVSGTLALTLVGSALDRESAARDREYERQAQEETERREREEEKIRRSAR